MLIYLTQSSAVDPRPRLVELGRALQAGEPISVERARELLIDYGELEAAVQDAANPERDDEDALTRAWREGAETLGRLFCRALVARPLGELVLRASEIVDALGRGLLPRRVLLRPPEGYAHYGLYPEQYVDAAQKMARAIGPAEVACVGLRSIGTSLSAAFAGALLEAGLSVFSFTARPRGAPDDRTLLFGPRLARALAPQAGDRWYAIVDEGPGLSGSSLCGAAAALERLGAPTCRIALAPSWEADASAFGSPAARDRWPRHRRFVGRFDPARLIDAPTLDWSAGAWRAHLPSLAEIAVQPEHERRKYLDPEARALHRFVGLGRHGRARLARAELLAQAGFGPAPLGLAHGLLALPLAPGRPASPGALDGLLVETIARYLAFVRRRFASPLEPTPLDELLAVNVRALVGEDGASALGPIERALARPGSAAVLDGRMLAHEWLKTASGWRKLDAIEHGDDHFYPGRPQDPVWDLAAAIVELELDSRAAAELTGRYAQKSGDRQAACRLPALIVAYLAFRGGYATVAAERLRGSPDGDRFARDRRRYVARLRRALAIAGRG